MGFSEAKVRLDKLPGWEPGSWAYHADDGCSFCQTTQGKPYGPKFAFSDVVGCGINFRTGQVFYTRNGVHLGKEELRIRINIIRSDIVQVLHIEISKSMVSTFLLWA